MAERFGADPRLALARRFGVDLRALAAIRVAVGAILLVDLALRARFLTTLYTDAGVFPRSALRESHSGLAGVSVHALTGTTAGVAALFLAAGLAALALLVGYRTTLATAVSLVLLASLHARNPLVLNAGDSLLRRLLLWGLFLPLGEVWSVDALRARGGSLAGWGSRADGDAGRSATGQPGAGGLEGRIARGEWVVSLATVGLLCQVLAVYVANLVFKLRSEEWTGGEALRYALELDRVTLALGDLLLGYPELLGVFQGVWLSLLVASVGLVALTGRARAGLAGVFATAHVGMALTLRIGLFPLISITALLAFLPPLFWDRVERGIAALGERVGGRVGTGALARVAGPVGWIGGGVLPDGVGRRVRRAWSTGPVVRWRAGLVRVVVAALLVATLAWNGATMGYVDAPGEVESVVDPDERGWHMFADPYRADGWYVVPARTDSGRAVDALHGGSPSFERPAEVSSMYPSHRWRMYLVDMRQPAGTGLRPYFAAGLCRRWNRTHDEGLRELTVYYVEQPTRLGEPDPVRRIRMLNHSCSG